MIGGGDPRLRRGSGEAAVAIRFEPRHRRPELRPRAGFGECERRQMPAGGNLAEDRVASLERRGRSDRLRSGDVHDVNHRRRRTGGGELLDDGGEGPHRLAGAACLRRNAKPEQPGRGDRLQILTGELPRFINLRSRFREDAGCEPPGAVEVRILLVLNVWMDQWSPFAGASRRRGVGANYIQRHSLFLAFPGVMTDVLKRNHVTVTGRGRQPLLFAHGFGCDQTMWRFITPAFEEDYRVILFDYVGSGKSDLS